MTQPLLWIATVLVFVEVAVTACSPARSDLQGVWVLESIDGQKVTSSEEIYFQIEDANISGFDGCNRFGGSLDTPTRLRITQRACASDSPRLPLDLSDPLRQLEAAKIDDGRLILKLPDGKTEAHFRRK